LVPSKASFLSSSPAVMAHKSSRKSVISTSKNSSKSILASNHWRRSRQAKQHCLCLHR